MLQVVAQTQALNAEHVKYTSAPLGSPFAWHGVLALQAVYLPHSNAVFP